MSPPVPSRRASLSGRRLVTVAVLVAMILVPVTPAVPSAGGDAVGEAPTPDTGSGPGAPDSGGDAGFGSTGPQVADGRASSPAESSLRLVENVTGSRGYTDPSMPVQSTLLDVTLPASAVPPRYVQKAAGEDHPLRSAILTWNDVMGFRDRDEVLEDAMLYRADEMPRDTQVAVAALLFALADASLLQEQAVEELDAAERRVLMDAMKGLMDPSVQVTDPAFVEAMEDVESAGSLVKMDKIQQASRIVTVTLDHVRPVLQRWADAEQAAAERTANRRQAMSDYLDTYSPESVGDLHRIERLDVLIDAMRLGTRLAGADADALPVVEPLEFDESLSGPLGSLTGTAGSPDAVSAHQTARADALPEALQQAVGRILVNYVAYLDAVEAASGGDAPNDGASPQVLTAQLRMLKAVKESAPTLEAFGLMYKHHAYAMMPKTPYGMPGTGPEMAELADYLTRPEAAMSELVHTGSMMQGAVPTTRPSPELPPRGALEDAVLDLYDRYGLEVNASTRAALQAGVENLPPRVERNAARVLQAQLSAVDRLTGLYGSLDEDERRLVADAPSAEAVQRQVFDGDVTRGELDRLRTYYGLLDKARDAYYRGSLEVALALDASKEDMVRWRDARIDDGQGTASTETSGPAPADGTWWSPVGETLSVLSPVGTASAQPTGSPEEDAIPCQEVEAVYTGARNGTANVYEAGTGGDSTVRNSPTHRVTDCDNDVLFMDPMLQTVVISGLGETAYEPGRLGRTARVEGAASARVVLGPFGQGSHQESHLRGQILSVDLGGDDTYRNNAGGSFLSWIEPNMRDDDSFRDWVDTILRRKVDPASVAVTVDLSGDDAYERPSVRDGSERRFSQQGQRSQCINGPFGFCRAVGVQGRATTEDRSPAAVTDRAIQGASLGGIGLLWDVTGDDTYEAAEEAQGFGGGFQGRWRDDMVCDTAGPPGLTHPLDETDPVEDATRPVCLFGLLGVGVLADAGGDDTYEAATRAQGAAGPMRTPDRSIESVPSPSEVPLVEEAWPSALFGGIGVLADRDGGDRYVLDRREDNPGQGHGDAGVGLLVEGDGDDTYRNGRQGIGETGGLGALLDLDGDDGYTRRHADTGRRYRDAECRTRYAAGDGDALPGFGVFVDLDPRHGCRYDPERLADDLEAPDPDRVVEDAVQRAEELIDTLGVDPGHDDEDGYPNAVETLAGLDEVTGYGWDSSDDNDYPAGFPHEDNFEEIDKPGAWPSTVPWPFAEYPPASMHGSPYIVEIPGVFVLGDARDTIYPGPGGSGKTDVDAVNSYLPNPDDHIVTLDLGGDDTYENTVGGRFQLAVDLLDGVDTYHNEERNCVHGCDGYLLDMGGDDAYLADRDEPFAQGASRDLSAALFDADGDDTYNAGDWSHGSVHKSGVEGVGLPMSRVGLLVDPVGDDTYRADSQGRLYSGGNVLNDVDSPLSGSALFLDLNGTDRYQPVGAQAVTSGSVTVPIPFFASHEGTVLARSAVFVDSEGGDTYVGTDHNRDSPDRSDLRNDRIRLRSRSADRFELFVDQDPAHHELRIDEGDPRASALDMPSLGVRVGGAGGDTYDRDYALLLDPAGNDKYRNNAGASLFRAEDTATLEQPRHNTIGNREVVLEGGARSPGAVVAALLWDRSGNDRYDASAEAGLTGQPTPSDPQQAAPDAGVATDTQASFVPVARQRGQLAQGAGVLGTGVLVDETGDDTYRARGLAQGASLLGSGVLWDQDGADRYTLAPNVVRNPSMHGEQLAWERFDGTAWRARALHPNPESSCVWTPTEDLPDPGFLPQDASATGAPVPTGPAPGSVQDLRVLGSERTLEDGTVLPTGSVLLSAWNPDQEVPTWDVYAVEPPGEDDCSPGDTHRLADDAVSHQRHPTLTSDGRVLWADNRDGNWSIFANPGPGATDAETRPFGHAAVEGSNQLHPRIQDDTLVWQDDRSGTWNVYAIDVHSIDQNNPPLKVSTALGGDRTHVEPDVSKTLIAWATRETGDEEDWDVAVYNRHAEEGEVALLDGPGDQFDPRVSGDRVLYTQTGPDGDRTVHTYRWGAEAPRQFRDDARHPALDPNNDLQAAWTHTDSVDRDCGGQDCETSSPYWEIVRRRVGAGRSGDLPAVDPASSDSPRNTIYSRLMQGAAFQGGLGALVDDRGVDTYRAQEFAQGAAQSRGSPLAFSHDGQGVGFGLPELVPSPDHGAHAALLDADGNDRYTADAFSQGSHFGREFRVDATGAIGLPAGLGAVPYSVGGVDLTENVGVLSDLRGRDRYVANARSQGAASLVVGTGTAHRGDASLTNGNPSHAPDVVPTLVGSVGLFNDLGGNDTYAYSDPSDLQHYPGSPPGVPSFPRSPPDCSPRLSTLLDGVRDAWNTSLDQEDLDGLRTDLRDTVNNTRPGPDDRNVYNWISHLCREADEVIDDVNEEAENQWSQTREAIADNRSQVNETIDDESPTSMTRAATQRDRDPNDRDDAVWTQWERSAGDMVGAADTSFLRAGLTERGTTFVAASPGGIGTDVGLVSEISKRVANRSEAALDVNLTTYRFPEGDKETPPLNGDSLVGAKLEARNDQGDELRDELDIQRVEFFIDGEFIDFGKTHIIEEPNPVCRGETGENPNWRWCLRWQTDSWDWPDGDYDVQVRVYYSVGNAPSLGYVEGERLLTVDNRPRIDFSNANVNPRRFSPEPVADDAPPHPTIEFTVSRDTDSGATTDHTTWVQVDAVPVDGGDAIPLASRNFAGDATTIDELKWDGRNTTTGTPVHGDYEIRVQARDDSPSGDDRLREAAVGVQVDAEPPAPGCVRLVQQDGPESGQPDKACNPGNATDPIDISRDRRDTAYLGQDQGRTDLFLTSPADDVSRAHVFTARSDGTWERQTLENLETGEQDWTLTTNHSQTTRQLVLFEDQVGNLECVPSCDPSSADLDEVTDQDRTDARERKIQEFGETANATFFSDFRRPFLRTPNLEKVYRIDGERKENKRHRVGPNSDVALRMFGEEETDTPVATVTWQGTVDSESPQFLIPQEMDATCTEPAGDECPEEEFLLTWGDGDAWGDLLKEIRDHADSDRLDIPLNWFARLRDRAGNLATDVVRGSLVLDSTPPQVLDSKVRYADDGTTVTEEGDPVTVEVAVEDPRSCIACPTPPNQDKLEVFLNASELTMSPPRGTPDRIPLKPKPDSNVFTATFPVDDPPVDLDDRANATFIPVTASDEAGNRNDNATVSVLLGDPKLGLSLAEKQVGLTTATLTSTTEVPTTATLRYGTDTLDRTLPSDVVSDTHVFEIEDLPMATRHRFEIVAEDDEGITSSLGGSFGTHAGLSTEVVEPGDASRLSGIRPIRVNVSVASDPDARPRVQIEAHNASLPGGTRLLADEATQVGLVEQDIITSALPDGVYDFTANVTYQSPVREERRLVTVENATLDNTPPSIQPDTPAPNASMASSPTAWTFDVEDTLSPVDAASATVRVNGDVVPGTVAQFVPQSGPGNGTLRISGVGALPSGPVRVTVTVADVAGNTGVTSLTVHHDPEAPAARDGTGLYVEYPGDQTAARPGQTVRLVASLTDRSEIAGVSVNASPLGGPTDLQLQRHGGDHVVDLRVPGSAAETVVLNVTAEDKRGNRVRGQVPVVVDDDPPTIVSWTAQPISTSEALVGVAVDEPADIAVEVRRDGHLVDRGRPLATEEAKQATLDLADLPSGDATTAVFRVGDLVPGETYDLDLRARDAAGRTVDATPSWRFEPVVVDPPSLAGVTAEALSDGRVRLTWTPAEEVPDGGARYAIYRADDGGAFRRVATTFATVIEDTVEPGSSYRYYVRAQNLEGSTGPAGPVAEVTVEAPPAVASLSVSPTRGPPDTPFTFRAVAEHADRERPAAWLVLDGTPHSMTVENASADCRTRCAFTTTIPVDVLDLETPKHRYHVEVVDAGQVLREPAEGNVTGPTVLAGSAQKEAAGGFPAVPVPGVWAIAVAAWVGAWIHRRRRKER